MSVVRRKKRDPETTAGTSVDERVRNRRQKKQHEKVDAYQSRLSIGHQHRNRTDCGGKNQGMCHTSVPPKAAVRDSAYKTEIVEIRNDRRRSADDIVSRASARSRHSGNDGRSDQSVRKDGSH